MKSMPGTRYVFRLDDYGVVWAGKLETDEGPGNAVAEASFVSAILHNIRVGVGYVNGAD